MRIFFDIRHIYYFPQYEPVFCELIRQGNFCTFVIREQEVELNKTISNYINNYDIESIWVKSSQEATDVYLAKKPDWIIFGHSFKNIEQLHQHSKTVIMQHGIGPKAYFQASKTNATVRFVEGNYRLKKLQRLYPENNFVDTGFAKLDYAVNKIDSNLVLDELGLDPKKKTMLYAPTFYPSSIECMPHNWPDDFSQYNIIIKPHFFSLYKKNLAKHRSLFKQWAKYSNVYVTNLNDISIIPFYKISDVLLSDASSTLFEFIALNKPAIWLNFYKLRWSYRGIFKFRYKKRVDEEINFFSKVAKKVDHYEHLSSIVDEQVNTPELMEQQRIENALKLVGKVDGKVSQRIVKYLLNQTSTK